MTKFIARRFLWMFLVLFVVSLITFALMHIVPGGPFAREKPISPRAMENIAKKFNLDAPLHEQYLSYVGGILIPRVQVGKLKKSEMGDALINISLPPNGDGEPVTFRWMDFGPSYGSQSRTVNDIFTENLPVSFQLGVAALAVAMAIGIPMGILAALKRNSLWDYSGMGVAILGVSIPTIIMGPLLQYIFGVRLQWLPVSGWGEPEHIIMPAFALGFTYSALLARLTRASLLQVLNEDYIRTARAKGLSERMVIMLHALKNSLIPVVTVIGPLFALLVTGTFVAETIFAVPGMGRFFVTSITNRDYSVIMGTILLYAAFLVVSNLAVDVAYAWLDPRIRYD